ncbi:MAG: hypothetical protein WEE64_11180 [Dehalococcoidia bacterium]
MSATNVALTGRSCAKGRPARAGVAGIGTSIGTLNEGHLHSSLKERYIEPGDRVEVKVGGYVVDILRGDLIIEVQTANFSAIATKMRCLVSTQPVRLVYPIPLDLWIVKLPEKKGGVASRRKSPRRRKVVDVFEELVSFPELITHQNFQLDVVLTQEEELRVFDGRKRWRRRGWATIERRLLEISEIVSLRSGADYMAFIPHDLPEEFLTSDIAQALGRPRDIAQKVAYCLRTCGLIEQVGRRGSAIVYSKTRL